MKRIVVIGGGAGGFFSAIACAEHQQNVEVKILEQSSNVLGKVKVSGGGRCNVTHACFIPKDLVKFYPRGHKELLGPFHSFMTGDTMEWFETRGVPLKVEGDNRVFPNSDSSQSIIDCLTNEAEKHGVVVETSCGVRGIEKQNGSWLLKTGKGEMEADVVIIATGSSQAMWKQLAELGHSIIDPIPSLFTFNTKDNRFRGLAGLSVPNAMVKINGSKLKEHGPLLVTHWGISGPAVLKLSSVGARYLHKLNYKFGVSIDWCFDEDEESVREQLEDMKINSPKQRVQNARLFSIPKRLWYSLLEHAAVPSDKVWGEMSKKNINKLVEELKRGQFNINGKSTNKEEFVTCGGVDLKEIDFKSFKSKIVDDLYIVGECLNIDALTGGFNFQAAWTGGYMAGTNMS